MTKTSFRSYLPAIPVVRYENGAEPCGRCGKPTNEKLLKKVRANQPQVYAECSACGWCRPASDVVRQ